MVLHGSKIECWSCTSLGTFMCIYTGGHLPLDVISQDSNWGNIHPMVTDTLEVETGVPQGSRLGPLLFIIYMNDIVSDIESDILIFVDDTSLMASGTDPAITAAQLNLVRISNWAKVWYIPPGRGRDSMGLLNPKDIPIYSF